MQWIHGENGFELALCAARLARLEVQLCQGVHGLHIGPIEPDGGSEVWQWRRSVDGHIVDTMANHLVQNTPGEDPSARYRTPLDLFTGAPATHVAFDSQQGSNTRFAWRGPYVSAPVRSDPWGNRYAINVRFLDAVSASDGSDFAGYVQDVFVLSAGPDEETVG